MLGGHVGNAPDSRSAVNHKTAGGLRGRFKAPLEEVIREDDRLVYIIEKMVDCVADFLGDNALVGLRKRFDQVVVEKKIEGKSLAVERLERIMVGFEFGPGRGILWGGRTSRQPKRENRYHKNCSKKGHGEWEGAGRESPPSSAGRIKSVQARIKNRARPRNFPISAMPGDSESARLPKADPVVRALKTTPRPVGEPKRPGASARCRMTK